jgi:hypothetical protein
MKKETLNRANELLQEIEDLTMHIERAEKSLAPGQIDNVFIGNVRLRSSILTLNAGEVLRTYIKAAKMKLMDLESELDNL